MGQQKINRNPFKFKQFTIFQDNVALPVTTDACLFGAWINPIVITPFSRVLDIGCGTGLLTFMVAQKQPQANFLGIDIHEASIQAANTSLSHWKEQTAITPIYFQHKNIVELSNPEFDVVICNPPFFSNQLESTNTDRNQARHTSLLTLENLISTIHGILNPQGSLFFMYPFLEKDSLVSTLSQLNFCIKKITEVSANSTKSPHLIFVHAVKNETAPNTPSKISTIEHRINVYLNHLTSSDDTLQNHYNLTPECVEMLKDYYIKL
ncbi:MAG: tRNA1(Val) (adenine(37)-N6)-methyltransferase [Bacteroidota bacterium]|jgi:tRNA1Val (adenine37-N6)-methyltransferase